MRTNGVYFIEVRSKVFRYPPTEECEDIVARSRVVECRSRKVRRAL